MARWFGHAESIDGLLNFVVGSLVHLVSLLDHDWYAAGGARLPDTPQGTADPLTTGYPHTYYILVLPAFFCRRNDSSIYRQLFAHMVNSFLIDAPLRVFELLLAFFFLHLLCGPAHHHTFLLLLPLHLRYSKLWCPLHTFNLYALSFHFLICNLLLHFAGLFPHHLVIFIPVQNISFSKSSSI